jgi:hypothetical protein
VLAIAAVIGLYIIWKNTRSSSVAEVSPTSSEACWGIDMSRNSCLCSPHLGYAALVGCNCADC